MTPKKVTKMNPQFLKIVWEDAREQIFSIQALRDNCPCAGCSGERVLMHEYVPPEPDRSTPGRYDLKGITPVGSYALQLTWGDGHLTGIYTYESLYNWM